MKTPRKTVSRLLPDRKRLLPAWPDRYRERQVKRPFHKIQQAEECGSFDRVAEQGKLRIRPFFENVREVLPVYLIMDLQRTGGVLPSQDKPVEFFSFHGLTPGAVDLREASRIARWTVKVPQEQIRINGPGTEKKVTYPQIRGNTIEGYDEEQCAGPGIYRP